MPKTFQEQLDEILGGFVSDEKKDELKTAVAPIYDAMGKTFNQYDADIKALKKQMKAAEAAAMKADGATIDPKVHDKLVSDFEDLELNYEKAKAELQKFETQLGDTTKKLAKTELTAKEIQDKLARESSLLDQNLLSGELRKEIGNLPLAEGTSDAVYDILSKNVRVLKDENGIRRVVAVVKDPTTGVEIEKSISDQAREWANKDPAAKRLLMAPRTTGMGSYGSGKAGEKLKPFKEMDLGERTKLFRENRVLYEQLEAASKE